jgi:hypothetical protein
MKPVPQRIVASGYDGGLPGDCVKCCVASILELPYEDVPHFVAGEVINPNLCEDGTPHPDGPFKMDWYGGLRLWMKERGYTVMPVHRTYFKDVDCQMAWRKERDAAGIDNSSRDCLWMYDARDQAPYHKGFWIASVISENFAGSTHAIVMQGNTVAFDPSTKSRRTPYQYVGEMTFVAQDASKCLAPIENQTAIAKWAAQTFGTPPSNISIAARANEEMAELLRGLSKNDNDPAAALEVADIVIVLARLMQLRYLGHQPDFQRGDSSQGYVTLLWKPSARILSDDLCLTVSSDDTRFRACNTKSSFGSRTAIIATSVTCAGNAGHTTPSTSSLEMSRTRWRPTASPRCWWPMHTARI